MVNDHQEVVFISKFLGDVGQLDASIFWSVQRPTEVEVLEIEACKSCSRA